MRHPYMVKTSNKYEVTGPDRDGEIEIDGRGDQILWLSKADLELMLSRFEPANESDCEHGK